MRPRFDPLAAEGAGGSEHGDDPSLDRPARVTGWHDGRSATFQQNVARFRLYRHRSLQENARFSAFFLDLQGYLTEILKFWQN